jgi:hypothetical protein
MRSWKALQPAINAELTARRTAYPEQMGHDFLPHFRVLVQMAINEKSPGVSQVTRHQKPRPLSAMQPPDSPPAAS